MNAQGDGETLVHGLSREQAGAQADAIYRTCNGRLQDILEARRRLLALARHAGDVSLLADGLLWGVQAGHQCCADRLRTRRARRASAGRGARLEVGNAPGGGARFSVLPQLAATA